jgi:hypothetical protein
MKKIIRTGISLNKADIEKMIKLNWWRSIYNGKFCMENTKTIFIPNHLPQFKVVFFQSKANDLIDC